MNDLEKNLFKFAAVCFVIGWFGGAIITYFAYRCR